MKNRKPPTVNKAPHYSKSRLHKATHSLRIFVSHASVLEFAASVHTPHSSKGGTSMPYLNIQTNREFDAATAAQLMQHASKTVSEGLGKSENYVMVALPPPVPMMFAGNDEPAAYLELKSIGLPQETTGSLSSELCSLVNKHLGIPQERIYIEFANAERTMWGWNGRTF
jgi:phenylpyruvate tautomerase PptA (4-oxalocrotonate tautomerase family)